MKCRLAVMLAAAAMATGSCAQSRENAQLWALPSATVEATQSAPAAPTPAAPTPARSPLPAGFVDLADVDPTILQDIRYYTEHNFVGRRIRGYEAPRCLLTAKAAEALREVQRAARAKDLSLKVYDCYRPRRAVADFRQWATGTPDDQKTKAEFYPGLSKSELLSRGWVAGGTSRHSRGSTVDLTLVALPPPSQRPYVAGETLVACTKGAGTRFPDNSIDMGTGFDCFDARSNTGDKSIPAQARANRATLVQLMRQKDFDNFDQEWWHYRLRDEPPGSDFHDFPIVP